MTATVVPVLALTLAEAAEALSFPPGKSGTAGTQRVYRLVLAKKLRAVKIGKSLRVPVAELDRFLADGAE